MMLLYGQNRTRMTRISQIFADYLLVYPLGHSEAPFYGEEES
jgi:hypothetical protein